MCQPLNAGNRQRCCEAANWRDIVLLWQQNQCERIRDKRSQQAGTIGKRGTNSGDDTQTGDNTPTTPGPGNPGNDKPVGHAGEHVSQGMMADGVGVHGASENHNHK
jgi:hypothetical protein